MTNNNEIAQQKQDFELIRFEDAQENIYPEVIVELRNGRKQSHWMWFIFPQLDGLGNSPTTKRYSIKSVEEAKAYLDHPLLGKRLLECFAILVGVQNRTAEQIFGYPDYLKLQSCVTLFSIVDPLQEVFTQVLGKYYNNKKDQRTIDLLNN